MQFFAWLLKLFAGVSSVDSHNIASDSSISSAGHGRHALRGARGRFVKRVH
jgi:hypothetical protein